MTQTFIANADFQVIDRQPVKLIAGETVTVTAPDRAWPGWVAIQTTAQRKAHIPGEFLAIDGSSATLLEAFDSTDLCVKRGDKILSLREIHGWHWCENQTNGGYGWLASYLLSPAE